MTEIDEIVANLPLVGLGSRVGCRRLIELEMEGENETIKTQATDALWERYVHEWPHDPFIQRIVEVTSNTRLGCIMRTILHDPRDYVPRFDKRAVITSDGYIMCGFTNSEGEYHAGAFVGSAYEMTRNLIGLSIFARLNGEEMLALGNAADEWISTDYRAGARNPPRLILNTDESERATREVLAELKARK